MKGRDEIKDLFSDKLGGYEAKVNPELWGKVASQIGAGSAATATGMALTTKLIIGLGAASVIAVTSFLVLNNEKDEVKPTQKALVEEVIPEPETIKTVEPNTLEVSTLIEPIEIEPVIIPEEPIETETDVTLFTPVLNIEDRLRIEDDPLQNKFTENDQLEAPNVGAPKVPSLESDQTLESLPSEEIITKESTEIRVVFPNVFTPNNDGVNDLLFISYLSNQLGQRTVYFKP